jgi:hypothetical protein
MNSLSDILRWHLDAILFFIVVILIVLGIGKLISSDMAKTERQFNACVESGKQYVSGSCVE